MRSFSLQRLPLAVVLLALFVAPAHSEMLPEWDVLRPMGDDLSAGLDGALVDAAGVSYVTGVNGPDHNNDIETTAYAPDGTRLWSHTFDGVEAWHDTSRGVTLDRNGYLYITGNTPDEDHRANVLVLKYHAATGQLVDSVQYSSGPGLSEHGSSIAVDAGGNMFVCGSTVGDGPDGLILKFDPAGNLLWRRTWDGPGVSPFSSDEAKQILLDPDGNPVVMLRGIMSSLHADYVVNKYDAETGGNIWQATWGLDGEDFARQMLIDPAGDIYVTGTGFDLRDQYSTIKLDGADGSLLWQRYDAGGIDDSAAGLALDGLGGVYITGTVDPDGNASNANNRVYTVKRDAATGDFRWEFFYGDSCVGCSDGSADVMVDPAGNVWVAASTSSPPYRNDAILFVLDSATGLELDRGLIFSDINSDRGFAVALPNGRYDVWAIGEHDNLNTGDTDIAVTKYSNRLEGIYDMAVSGLVAGGTATVAIEEATPGVTQYVLAGVSGLAPRFVPPLGAVVEIADPRLAATITADANGGGVVTLPIPAGAAGKDLWIQVAETGRTAAPTMGRVAAGVARVGN